MAIRKNKKFIDPRYFMDEKTDIIEEGFTTTGPDPGDALSTDDLFKLMKAGYSGDDLRGVNNTNLTPEMASILGRPQDEPAPDFGGLAEGGDAGHLDRQKAGWERAMDAAEAERTPEEEFQDTAMDLAKELGVEVSVEKDLDGHTHIVVHREGGRPTVYNDPDEMYDALSKERDPYADESPYDTGY